MQRDRELDGAEIRRQVAARARDRADEECPQLARQFGKLRTVEPTQRGRVVDLIEYGIHDGQRSRSTIQSASSESRRADPPSGRSAP